MVEKSEEWVDTLDLAAFKKDIRSLGDALRAGQGDEDVQHLNKIIWWSNLCVFIGLTTAGILPWFTLVPAIFLSLGITSRWTMVAHHTCHGGYDNCDKSGRFNRFKFAVGSTWRRAMDWFDWMLPEAWNVEHNHLHHYHLGEQADPDLLERNAVVIRESNWPAPLKYMAVMYFMLTWKFSFYASNTYKELRINQMRRNNPAALQKSINDGKKPGQFRLTDPLMATSFITRPIWPLPSWLRGLDFLFYVIGPYFLYRFIIFPAPWLALGYYLYPSHPFGMYQTAIWNCVIADLLSNVHSFVIIVTNHAGNDLYKFPTECKPRSGTFYLRAVISSANFAAGTDTIDFLHGWLNYQIEHHLWPDLSMLSYQRAMPKVKAICKKHGVPYIQESVFVRLRKTVDITTGATSMRMFDYELGEGHAHKGTHK